MKKQKRNWYCDVNPEVFFFLISNTQHAIFYRPVLRTFKTLYLRLWEHRNGMPNTHTFYSGGPGHRLYFVFGLSRFENDDDMQRLITA